MPGQDFSLGALARGVEDFCAALGLDAVDLVANDTGGAVAQIFAARNPGLVRTLTLTNCDVHDNVPPEAFRPTVDLAASGALSRSAAAVLADPALARAALGAGFERPEDVADADIRAYLEPVLGTVEDAREFERFLLALKPDDLLAAGPALRALQAPTLVVWGDGDPFFDVRWAYWLKDAIPGVTSVVQVPGARLFFPDERPDDLVPHLRRHWLAHPAGRPGWRTRPERPGDAAVVRDINLGAFPTAEEAGIVEALRADADAWIDGLSIIAETADGAPVGYALLTRCQVGDAPALVLGPCAVLPSHQRTGAGAAAIRAGLDAARRMGENLVVVLGHAEYYPRFGFRRASEFGISTSFEVPDEALMALALDGSRPVPSGVIRYPDAFGV